jgi:hypothetical protein
MKSVGSCGLKRLLLYEGGKGGTISPNGLHTMADAIVPDGWHTPAAVLVEFSGIFLSADYRDLNENHWSLVLLLACRG